jgi:hypothetical protein
LSNALISERVWPTVAAEVIRFWLRRHRTFLLMLSLFVALTIVALLTGRSDQAERILILVAFFAPITVGLLSMSGIVADERESGILVIWIQKPGTILRYYAVRYGLYVAMIAVFVLALSVILAAIAAQAAIVPISQATRLPLLMVPMSVIAAAMVFAFSAWGVRRDSTAALLAIIAFVTVASRFAFRPGPARDILMKVAFPVDALVAVGGAEQFAGSVAHPFALIFLHFVAWTVLALVGLLYTQRTVGRAH